MNKLKSNPSLTILTITVGFLFIYIVGLKKYDVNLEWALLVALLVGLVGILSNKASKAVEWFWFKLTLVLSYIVPNIILGLVYFVILFPLSVLSKIFRKKSAIDSKNTNSTIYNEVNKVFDAKSMQNPW